MTVTAYDWSEAEIITKKSTGDAYRQCISLDSNGTIHLVWKDTSDIQDAGSDWDLFYATKPKESFWTEQTLITPDSTQSITCLSIGIDSTNQVHVAWKQQTNLINDTDIYYMKGSVTNGWTDPLLISINSSGICSCPSLYVDAFDTIHLSWADTTPIQDSGSDADLYYVKKPFSQDWSNIELVTPKSTEDAIDPYLIAGLDQKIHLVWYEKDNQGKSTNIYYSMRSVSESWSTPYNVSEGCPGTSSDPTIQIDSDNNVHIVWNDNSVLFDNGNDYDLFYRKKSSNDVWDEIELVTPKSQSNCKWPTMLIHEEAVYVAWSDQTPYNQNDTDFDICFSKKIDTSWVKPEIVSKESKVESNWPRFVIDANNEVHMTWWDRTPSQWVIYYSRGIPTESHTNETSLLSLMSIIVTIATYSYVIKKRK